MHDQSIDQAVWLVPLLLLALQFALKLFVFERPGGPIMWESLIQSPVDVAFLALSFVAAALIGDTARPDLLTVFLVYVLCAVVSIVLWKGAPTGTSRKQIAKAGVLVLVNFGLTTLMLVYSVSLLVG